MSLETPGTYLKTPEEGTELIRHSDARVSPACCAGSCCHPSAASDREIERVPFSLSVTDPPARAQQQAPGSAQREHRTPCATYSAATPKKQASLQLGADMIRLKKKQDVRASSTAVD